MPAEPNMVFVAMSFDNKYYPIFTLVQAIAAENGAKAVRADEEKNVIRRIKPGIFSKIKNSDLIVAEISSGSPNVLYEVGWAHAMGKPTMLIAEKDAPIPFDINDYMVVKYDPTMAPPVLRKHLESEFVKHLNAAKQGVNLRQPLVEMLGSMEDVISHADLFTHLLGWTVERFAQESKQWTGDQIRVNSAEAIEKGIKVFNLLKRGGFATYLVPLNAFWTTDTKYLEECRLAARFRGAKIDRVFILPNHEALFSESLQDHVKRDEDAGIRTFIAFVDNVPDKDAIQDFGIWDDELLCLIEVRSIGGDTAVGGCTFGRNKFALEKAQQWKESIMSIAQPAPDLLKKISELNASTQLLVRSMSVMQKDARQYCRGSYLTGNMASCEWYHASWQALRLLGLVSTPDWHSEFYAQAFGNAFGEGARDILVSGTADYAIVDHIARAIPKEQLQHVIISVLDVCATPLEICRWYDRWFEQRQGIHLNLRFNQRDALNTGYNGESFDVITSDAFLTRFNNKDRESLIAEWFRILKPGGRIITTIRYSTRASTDKITASQVEIDNFVAKVDLEVEEKHKWLRPMKAKIIHYADEYARNIISFPIHSEEYICELLRKFQCTAEVGITKGEFEGATKYARVVAIKK